MLRSITFINSFLVSTIWLTLSEVIKKRYQIVSYINAKSRKLLEVNHKTKIGF